MGEFHTVGLLLMIASAGAAILPEVMIDDVTILSPTTLSMSWTPSYIPRKGKLTYIVRYRQRGEKFQRIQTSRPELTLTNLTGNTTYILGVRSVKGKDKGQWSKSREARTKELPRVTGKVTLDVAKKHKARISWTVQHFDSIKYTFKSFLVTWKINGRRNKTSTLEHSVTLSKLEVDTKYVVTVYIRVTKGKKIKLDTLRFRTKDNMKAPRNFKEKEARDTSISVRWRLLRSSKRGKPVTGYVLQYKRIGSEPPENCTIELDNNTRSYKIEGLLPSTHYGVRVAGQYGTRIGPFTKWLEIETYLLLSSSDDIRDYYLSDTEVVLLWRPVADNVTVKMDLYEQNRSVAPIILGPWHIHHYQYLRPMDPREGIGTVLTLSANTSYRVILTETPPEQCTRNTVSEFVTGSRPTYPKLEDCDLRLRIFPLPEGKHVVTWSLLPEQTENYTLFYVIRMFGGVPPALESISVVPGGTLHHVLDGLVPSSTYTIELLVYDMHNDSAVARAAPLLVLAAADTDLVLDAANVTHMDEDSSRMVVPVSSIDVLVQSDHVGTFPDRFTIQPIQGTTWTLVSRNEPEVDVWTGTPNVTDPVKWFYLRNQTGDGIDITFSDQATDAILGVNASGQALFLETVSPIVQQIQNITVMEGQTIAVTCTAYGHYPYPAVTWYNMTTNQTIDECDMASNITVSDSQRLGKLTTHGALYGVSQELVIGTAELWDTGLYACAADNDAERSKCAADDHVGKSIAVFFVTVTPRPPRSVRDMESVPVSPFEIHVSWKPPLQRDVMLQHYPVLGYAVEVSDEFSFVLMTFNTTNTSVEISQLEPNTLYQFSVRAYNKLHLGETLLRETRTRAIPKLGPPEKVAVTTHNSSTMQISWESPMEVTYRQVRLRTYLFYHRKLGARKSEEIQLSKSIVNISIIDLEPESRYEVRVLAMSEDGQVSYSDWIQGSTLREAYMDESRPPPPPLNVYLRPEAGNIIVSWLPPFPDENILVRGYAIDVFNNGSKRESMEVGFEESSVIVYESDMGILYQISVKAKNNAGFSIDEWAELYIPTAHVSQYPVQDFRGVGLSSTKLVLYWDPPLEGAFSHFVMSYTLAGNEAPELPGGGQIPASVTSYVVRSLQPFTDYLFTITPYLKRIKGVSANTTVITFSDRPSGPPRDISIGAVNSTAILIKCSPPKSGKNGVITSYKISYRTKRTWRNDLMVPAQESEELDTYITELLPATVYEFRLRALTINGSGPWSLWLQTRTWLPDPILPKPPRELLTRATARSISLSWLSPDQDGRHITGYVVGSGKFIPEVNRYSVTSDKNIFTLKDLVPDTVYIISVRSFNEYGESAAIFDLVTTLQDTAGKYRF